MKRNYSVHHGSPHAPQQNGELQVCNIGAITIYLKALKDVLEGEGRRTCGLREGVGGVCEC